MLAAIASNLSKNISIGLNFEGIKRTGDLYYNYQGRALVNPAGSSRSPIASNDAYYQSKFNQFNLRIGLGIACDFGNNHLGLLVRFPEIGLFENDTILSDNLTENIGADLSGNPIDILASTRQENLDVTWKNLLT